MNSEAWWKEHRAGCSVCRDSRGSVLNVCDGAWEMLWRDLYAEAKAEIGRDESGGEVIVVAVALERMEEVIR